MSTWYHILIFVYVQGPVATKFRKGACENCGAMTHKKKDCLEVWILFEISYRILNWSLVFDSNIVRPSVYNVSGMKLIWSILRMFDVGYVFSFNISLHTAPDQHFSLVKNDIYHFFFQRPRKTGAKYSNTDIAPDEYMQPDMKMDFDLTFTPRKYILWWNISVFIAASAQNRCQILEHRHRAWRIHATWYEDGLWLVIHPSKIYSRFKCIHFYCSVRAKPGPTPFSKSPQKSQIVVQIIHPATSPKQNYKLKQCKYIFFVLFSMGREITD